MLSIATGNRYVGQFEGGCKSGSGVFYHASNGQRIQHGFWSKDICKTSLLSLPQDKNNEFMSKALL